MIDSISDALEVPITYRVLNLAYLMKMPRTISLHVLIHGIKASSIQMTLVESFGLLLL